MLLLGFSTALLSIDHEFAPDHWTYFNNPGDVPFKFAPLHNYEASWNLFVGLFKSLGMTPTTPFFFGFLCYSITIYVVGRIYEIKGNKLTLFYIAMFFDYTAICSFTVDKSAVAALLFWGVLYLTVRRSGWRALFFSLILITLLFYVRAWLLVPLMVLVGGFWRNQYIILIPFIVVFAFVVISNTSVLFFAILPQFLLTFPYYVFDPLPRLTNKFFEDGVLGFLLLCWLAKGVILSVAVTSSALPKIEDLRACLLWPVLLFSTLVVFLAAYFNQKYGNPWNLLGTDFVRKSLVLSPLFWGVLLGSNFTAGFDKAHSRQTILSFLRGVSK